MALRLQNTTTPAAVELVDGDTSDEGDELYLKEFFVEDIDDQWTDVVNLIAHWITTTALCSVEIGLNVWPV